MHDSVRQKSLESLLVTLPSISSETWAMHSSDITGSSVLYDWLFLVLAGVSLETAANFLSILNVAMIPREKLSQLWRLIWFFKLVTKNVNLFYFEAKGLQQKQTVDDFQLSTLQKGYQFL